MVAQPSLYREFPEDCLCGNALFYKPKYTQWCLLEDGQKLMCGDVLCEVSSYASACPEGGVFARHYNKEGDQIG